MRLYFEHKGELIIPNLTKEHKTMTNNAIYSFKTWIKPALEGITA